MTDSVHLAELRTKFMIERITGCHVSFVWPTQDAVDRDDFSIETVERQPVPPNEPVVYYTARIVMGTNQFFHVNFGRFQAEYGFNFFKQRELSEGDLIGFFHLFCRELTLDTEGSSNAVNPAMGGYGYSRIRWDLLAATGAALFICTRGEVVKNDWSKLL